MFRDRPHRVMVREWMIVTACTNE